MSRPTILTVDDDPQVSAALTRDLKRRYGSEYRVLSATSAAQALELLGALALRTDPVALIVSDQRMPEKTGIELLGESRERRARGQAPAAHGVRRHRRRDRRDQRHRPRLLPAQAVGPAGGPAVPGDRRPARRLATRPPGGHRRHPGRRRPLVRPHPRAEDVPGPQPRPLPLVRRGARRRGRAAVRARRWRARRPAAGAGPRPRAAAVADAARGRRRPRASTSRPSSRSTTSASSAAARPGSRPGCTPPPRA